MCRLHMYTVCCVYVTHVYCMLSVCYTCILYIEYVTQIYCTLYVCYTWYCMLQVYTLECMLYKYTLECMLHMYTLECMLHVYTVCCVYVTHVYCVLYICYICILYVIHIYCMLHMYTICCLYVQCIMCVVYMLQMYTVCYTCTPYVEFTPHPHPSLLPSTFLLAPLPLDRFTCIFHISFTRMILFIYINPREKIYIFSTYFLAKH